MDTVIVDVAQYAIALVVLGGAYAWWRAGRQDKVTMAVAGAVTLVLLLVGIKLAAHLWVDPRPFVVDGRAPLFTHPPDNGFPSDHTALGVAAATVVMFWRRGLGLLMLLVALLVGAARVAAHVHHVPDITGGAVIGAVCALLGVLLGRWVVGYVAARRVQGQLARGPRA